ncbi:protein FAM161A [Toxorhynchites rutilus septentrionalis]|uniref:protein FAM161A n=1 Tax=Toxorhynchites rutilus septentrionalis TaxID=329112 RepID=UPI00247936E1|nr:protein FAM161A [Toxorhynchites rutilus septentrionalis]XP_055636235.1 protein FAM161A [Toxorhynchites rutilus septentrionalis]
MSGHGRSVFLNSCIKKPLNPRNKLPNPSYLVPECSLDRGLNDPQTQENVNMITRKKVNSKCPLARTTLQRSNKCCPITHQLRKETDNFQSLVKFYDSIPDYDDLNHLPNEEFYCKLNTLRKKQRELRFACFNDLESNPRKERRAPVVSVEAPTASELNDDNDSLHSWSKPPSVLGGGFTTTTRKNAPKSVRIETTKEEDDSEGNALRPKIRAGTPFVSDLEDSTKNASSCTTPVNSEFVERYDRYVKRNLRSKSASPIRDYSKITIPRPYKMTQREEEGRALQELLIASREAFSSKEALHKSPSHQIKANPVPITSRIPLFDTIVADQEYRNRLAKLNAEIELQSQMQPFHFSERLSRPNSRCLSRSLSSPALLTTGFEREPKPAHTFKAKPCPKNLFSNYFYFKMWEDEYFRNMSKRVRAEELLKQSHLPPSMARREKTISRRSCLSRADSLNSTDGHGKKSKRKRKAKRSAKRKKSIEERCAEYFAGAVSNAPEKPQPKSSGRPLYPSSNSSCSTSGDLGTNPAPIYPVNRPNLAATLRTEWCRKKLRDIELEDSGAVKKPSRPQWGVKKSQAFQNLNLDHSHQEELNLRLATRKAEQKLRQEEHAINMELMRQRVKAAPLLLEGPPQWGPRLGHVAHRCMTSGGRESGALFRKSNKTRRTCGGGANGTKRESSSCGRIGHHDRSHRSNDKQRSSSGSKLSNYSLDSIGKSSSKFCDSEVLCKLNDELGSLSDDV